MVLKNLLTGQQWRNRHREQTYGHGERGGEGERYGKSNMETYITICKIGSQREFAVWLRKLKRALHQPRGLEWGWRGEGGSMTGSSPGGSRVIRRGDGVGEEKTYLFINIRLD